MSIKKSTLEQKWYYRIAKVIFLWVPPILVAVAVLLVVSVDMKGTGKDLITTLQNDSPYLFYALVGLILYFLILKGIWRGFLYVVFGGLEDDTIKINEGVVHQPTGQISQPSAPSGEGAISDKDKKEIGFYIFILIMIGLFYWIYTYQPTAQNLIPDRNNGGGNTCISTGCGSRWRCNGSYYSDGVKRSVNGCYSSKTQATTLPSWSGTCRQCP